MLRGSGGKRIGEAGYALEPAVFSGVRDNMPLAQEEVFGPVHTIMTPYSTLDEVMLG
jgi:acyl-CoA reductase-like NAD-dependent aldehyde dehydrogenase